VVIVIIVFIAMRGGSKTSDITPASAPGSSLKELLAAGGSQQCSFSSTDATSGARTSATVFVTAGHMRGDFTGQAAGGTAASSHMIVDGETSYLWSDGSVQGVKMSFANLDAQASPSGQQQPVNLDQKANYSCKTWSPDNSTFALPTGVTFTDLSALPQ